MSETIEVPQEVCIEMRRLQDIILKQSAEIAELSSYNADRDNEVVTVFQSNLTVLRSRVAELERENADWLKYYNEMQSLDYPSRNRLDVVKRAAYDKVYAILNSFEYLNREGKWLYDAIKQEMEKGGAE